MNEYYLLDANGSRRPWPTGNYAGAGTTVLTDEASARQQHLTSPALGIRLMKHTIGLNESHVELVRK